MQQPNNVEEESDQVQHKVHASTTTGADDGDELLQQTLLARGFTSEQIEILKLRNPEVVTYRYAVLPSSNCFYIPL